MKELIRALRDYCWDLAHYDDHQDLVVKRMNELMTKKGLGGEEAALTAAAENPLMARDPELTVYPNHFLEELALKMAEDKGIDAWDALASVEKRYPQVAQLAEIFKGDPGLFQEACHRAGMMGGKYRLTESNTIDGVLEWVGRVQKEREDRDWPRDPRTGSKLSLEEATEVMR